MFFGAPKWKLGHVVSRCLSLLQHIFVLISKFQFFNFSNYAARLPFGSTKKRKVATKLISYKRYGEILFQNVASGYLLQFVQDGSSKNALYK